MAKKMLKKIICPVCKKKLSIMNAQHLGSKEHKKALKEAGIRPSNDPALKLKKKPETKKKRKY